MTIDRLLDFLAHTNPGFVMIAAGLLMPFMRGTPMRAAMLVGGPVLALTALIYSAGAGADLSTVNVMGMELVLYRPDSLSMVFGLAFILAAIIAGIYSLHRRAPVLDSSALIYGGAGVGAVFVGDLVSLFLFWELTAVASVLQVLANPTRANQASALRYLMFQLGSGLLLMAGVATLYSATGVIAFAEMAQPGATPPVGVIDIEAPGALLILAAFAIKAAFPMVHNWLQDFYPRASETGAVVLSAFTTKLAVYALARCFAGLDALIWIGAVMTVFPVFFAVVENDLRKVLSYSLNNQVGFMVCAIGLGTELALNGAAAHAFAHIIYKSLLFMSMGAVLLRIGTTKATELGGLHRTMPYTTLFCLIGAASIAAVPLFAGFAAKSMIMSAAHAGPGLYIIWLMLLFASAGVMEHSGIKIPYFAFFGHDSGKRPKEAPFNMLLAMGLAAALCIGIGVSPGWLYQMLPYPDVALEYLAQDLWTWAHVLEQAQLLVFATLAFVILQRMKLYPAERRGVILDMEWLWRMAAPRVGAALTPGVGAALVAADRGRVRLERAGGRIARGLFAPDGLVARRGGLSRIGVWTLVVLAGVLVLAMAAGRLA